jgi:tetratricopeptide (TPR) repeat protein
MGDEQLLLGDTEQAISNYAKVLSLQPYKTDPSGIQYFDKVLEKKPNDIDALNAKGTSMVKLGRSEGGFTIIYKDNLDEAISYFDSILAIEPNNVDGLLNKGKALFQLDNPVEGMEYVDRAMEIDPNNVDILTFKGDELLRTNQTAQGIKLIDAALAIDPKDINALFLKGRTLILQENYNDAFYYFDEVLDSNPNHIIAAENIKLIADILGYKKLDGFLDVKIHNSQGLLAGHLRVNNLKLLNHTNAENLVNEWPVTQIITRTGQEYEVLQYHVTKKAYMPKYNGGAVHFGIKYEHYDKVWDILSNYWMYRVQKGDTIDFVYTAFRPVV